MHISSFNNYTHCTNKLSTNIMSYSNNNQYELSLLVDGDRVYSDTYLNSDKYVKPLSPSSGDGQAVVPSRATRSLGVPGSHGQTQTRRCAG